MQPPFFCCRKPDVHVCLILSRKYLTFREKERCSPGSIETLGDKFHDYDVKKKQKNKKQLTFFSPYIFCTTQHLSLFKSVPVDEVKHSKKTLLLEKKCLILDRTHRVAQFLRQQSKSTFCTTNRTGRYEALLQCCSSAPFNPQAWSVSCMFTRKLKFCLLRTKGLFVGKPPMWMFVLSFSLLMHFEVPADTVLVCCLVGQIRKRLKSAPPVVTCFPLSNNLEILFKSSSD